MTLALIAIVLLWLALILVCFSLAGAAKHGDKIAERAFRGDRWDGWRN